MHVTLPELTRKRLVDWAGEQVVREAEGLVDRGLVMEVQVDPPWVRGAVLWNHYPLRTSFEILSSGLIESHCPCRLNRERGLVCPHTMALGVWLLRHATDSDRGARLEAELRRARRVVTVDERAYLRRATSDTPGAVSAGLHVVLGPDWRNGFRRGRVPLRVLVQVRGQSLLAPDEVRPETPLILSRRDENLLYVFEDICGGPPRGSIEVSPGDFLNLLEILKGHHVEEEGVGTMEVGVIPLTTHLRMVLDETTGEIVLSVHTELPLATADTRPFHMVFGRKGWVAGGSHFWPLSNVLPTPYHALYEESVRISRAEVLRFLRRELPLLRRSAAVESTVTEDLFTVEPAEPRFRLIVCGSPASLSARLLAVYGALEVSAGAPDPRDGFGVPDPEDLLHYFVRNPEAEQEALDLLAKAGLKGSSGASLEGIVGNREVLNFLGGHLPALRRRGWQIELHGRIQAYLETAEFVVPVVRIRETEQSGWFDVGFEFEDGSGVRLLPTEVHDALRRGEAFVRRGNRPVLIDVQAVEAMHEVFADCATAEGDLPGTFRIAHTYAPYVHESLRVLDGVDVEEPPEWKAKARTFRSPAELEPVTLPPELDRRLRPYQKEAVRWLHFLFANGFGGILADEMGLGKTVETLAWLTVARRRPELQGKPFLIVCPSSLVENWVEEAARFTPDLRSMTWSGPDRHNQWEHLALADLVVTSYAVLRRDVERLAQVEFGAVVLDEAQHIKNRSTQNAQAAKSLRAVYRLVLTGTPLENSVADLWSIMDYLMPGYLGSAESFRLRYELPVSRQTPDAEPALARLRRKLRPFLLRRRRSEVARDLPPKIQRVLRSSLTPEQKAVYTELLTASRRRLQEMVSRVGFHAARIEILTTLLRLRQVCCHLGLLNLPGLAPRAPSGKLEQFLELLDEATDGGHRMLVFSQFVSMLQILRAELDQRNVAYCYLDGSTRERMQVVHRFNSDRSMPVFLISLKAGGTGLNLTGADMVVHFDPWWNPAVEEQATDRAYRIGQRRTVYSIKLIAAGTVEEKVLALQERKRSVIEATLESDEALLEHLTWDDVRELLAD